MSDFNNKLVIDLFKQRDELKRENEALKQRINRLEEAGDYIVEENDIHIGKEVWRKAKEAKP